MSNPADIKEALAGIERGDKVILQLADGTELEGRLAASADDQVQLADSEAVALDQVEDVLVQISSDGIE